MAQRSISGAGLRRELSVWEAIGLSLALMAPSMAANINPQGTAGTVGRAVPLAFALATIGVLLIAYTFVRLSQRFHHAGSVYGFVGESLRSDYQPMNGSALVLGNPAAAPLQQYSEFVMPNLLVESFIDQVPQPGGGIREGGTLARTLQLDLVGTRSYLIGQLDYGYIPAE